MSTGNTYSAIARAKAVELLFGSLELLGWDDGLEDVFGDVPQLLVLGLEQDHHAGTLRVEAAGNMEDRVLDNLLDAGVGDGRAVLELVVGAALHHGVEERLGGHVGGGC